MEDIHYENYIENYPKPISLNSTEKIIVQMKNSICKINLLNGNKGTGFFCKILYKNKIVPLLITNNHVINQEILNRNENILITINNNEEKEINLENRIKYTNEEYDITIIEIKENEDQINNYLELDDKIVQNKSNISYIKKSIYIIQYEGDNEEVSVSYGIIQGIDEKDNYIFKHLSNTDKGASGSPILNIKNNKLIGMHKETSSNDNKGIFLNYAIQDFFNIQNTNINNNSNFKYLNINEITNVNNIIIKDNNKNANTKEIKMNK